jgi:hypothetical protein
MLIDRHVLEVAQQLGCTEAEAHAAILRDLDRSRSEARLAMQQQRESHNPHPPHIPNPMPPL